MNAVTTTLEKYQQLIESQQDQLPGAQLPWLQSQRQQAAQRFLKAGFPTRKSELWRYTNVDSLLNKDFVPPAQDKAATLADTAALVGSQNRRIVFINGKYSEQLSRLRDLPKGVYIASVQQAMAERGDLLQKILEKSPTGNFHVFNDLNTVLFHDGMVFYVEENVELAEPVEVIYLTSEDSQTFAEGSQASAEGSQPAEGSQAAEGSHAYVISPRNLVWLEAGASATLIERYVGEHDNTYFTNGLSEIVLNTEAKLEHYRLQEESLAAYHISTLFVHHEAQSQYKGNTIVLGGKWSRTDYNVDFQGEQAQNRLDGLYLVKDKQLADIHLNVNHAVPKCSSEQDFRGILLGAGRGVFDGLINVAEQAQKTEAHLHNANLMLSRSAEVDTKPQLLIYADDVKCSHGTTVGQLEPEQLFYLRSRGISETEAKKMLCVGFAQAVLEQCSVGELRTRAEEALSESLLKKPTTIEL
jgi:Fe-S cluster assembly protein SufD